MCFFDCIIQSAIVVERGNGLRNFLPVKILINTPDTSQLGGVASHYNGLFKHWNSSVKYNFISGRNGFPGFILLPYDLLDFFLRLLFGKYDVVILNPSLRNKALKRDALFLLLASFFNVKKIVFFHGWSDNLSSQIDENPVWFYKAYSKADCFFVLSQRFKLKLNQWGIDKPVYLTSTKVDTTLLEYNSIKKKTDFFTVLFLSRVEEYKGIFIVLDTFKLLKKKFPTLKLVIAGDGSSLKSCRHKVQVENILDVTFLGAINGKEIADVYTNADLYILPSYSEGMPTSMLEAMAFGLPIITTPVGGIPDFFDTNMGALVDSREPLDFFIAIKKYLDTPDEMKRISNFNKEYAQSHFLASAVALDIEKKLESLFQDRV